MVSNPSSPPIKIILPLVISLAMVCGMAIGYRLRANNTNALFLTLPQPSTTEQVKQLILQNALMPHPTDSLTAALNQQLAALNDPYGNYYTAADYAKNQTQRALQNQHDSLTYTLLNNGTLALLSFTGITHKVYLQFMHAAEAMSQKKIEKIIIDLRNNTGGSLSDALSIADELLDGDRTICSVVTNKKDTTTYRCKKTGLLESPSIRVAILINERTAAEAEVIAAALQTHHRARLLGSPTKGKSLNQQTFGLTDGHQIVLSTSIYLNPNQRTWQKTTNILFKNQEYILPDLSLPATAHSSDSTLSQAVQYLTTRS